MKCHILCLAMYTLVALCLTSCTAGIPKANTDAESPISATPSAQVNGSLSVEVTPSVIQTITSPVSNNEAISYEEIKRSVDHITKRDVNPAGPEVGPDGVVDQKIVEALEAYNRGLSGKRAVNWHGWYGINEDVAANQPYEISISMQSPQQRYGDVLIWSLAADEAQQLNSLHYGQPVVFSGIIDKSNSAGQIEIHDATITPVK